MRFKPNLQKRLCCFLCLFVFSFSLHAQQTDLQQSAVIIKQYAGKIGLSEEDLKNFRVSDAYTDQLSGATLYYLQQTYLGVDVLNAVQTVAIKDNMVLSITGTRIQNVTQKVNRKDAVATVSAENAVRAMARRLNIHIPGFVQAVKSADEKRVVTFTDLGVSSVPVKSKLLWVPDSTRKRLILCWQVEVQPKSLPDYWLVHVDAGKGNVTGMLNLNVSCSWNPPAERKNMHVEDELFTSSGYAAPGENSVSAVNAASYRVVPFPAESPEHSGGTPALVSNPWELAGAVNNATTLKWHDNGTTTYDSTRGNNVLAREDADNNNSGGKGAHSSTAEPSLTFDFVPDFAQQPGITVNQNFGITNLFYWNNILHDVVYQYGFDEISGNFQANNLSRGGVGNDFVYADAQDGAGTNNANFATPADGQSPRMQMFLFDGFPKIDGDLDNSVIAHEFTHGISSRLTGGPSQAACLQNAEQMGEGWSDYIALMVTTDWKTATVNDGTKRRAIGNYIAGYSPTGPGIRTYPYSTDLAINPWTFADLKTLPPDYYVPNVPEAHLLGEIWCAMLWDMTWNIIQQDGLINTNIYNANGSGGNSAAFKLVMEGMKLQPCSPGFVDGRNAILKADTLLFAGKYSCAIWKAFTRRGLGTFAAQGNSNIWGDEVADFNHAKITKTVNKDSAVQGEQLVYTLQVTADKCVGISNYKLVDTLAGNITYISSAGTYNATNRTVTFSNISLAPNATASYSITATVNTGTYTAPVVHMNETVTSTTIPATDWANSSTEQNNKWIVRSNLSHSAPYSFYFNDVDSAVTAKLTMTKSYTLTGNSTLSFWHYYNTEASWDGGYIEITTNNGFNYTDLGRYIIQNGYTGNLNDINSVRRGFTGKSDGFIQTIVDLSAFKGKNVRIRFVFTSDLNSFVDGWYVDDIVLKSESGIMNTAQLFDNSSVLTATASALTTITNGTLPVSWGEFTAVKAGSTSLLKWQTLQEYNTADFIVERSTDGNSFHKLTTIKAAGNAASVQTYLFTDHLPLNGRDYYRIKQVDKDGGFTYSAIRQLDFLLNKSVIITPNPAKDRMNITVTGNEKLLNIYIMDATGKQVRRLDMTGQYKQFELTHMVPGVYYIRVQGDDVNSTQKLIIQ